MYSPNSSSAIALLQKTLEEIPQRTLLELVRSLSYYPDLTVSPCQNLLNALLQEYASKQRVQVNAKVPELNQDIFKKAISISQALATQLKLTLSYPQYLETVDVLLQKRKNALSVSKPKGFQIRHESRSEQFAQMGKTKSAFNFEVIKGPSQKYEHIVSSKGNQTKIGQTCVNLTQKPQCLCPNERELLTKDDFSFLCKHCNRLYHTICMKKKANSQFCCYCHIERMAPLKRVVSQIYIGLFRKSSKKHYTSFFVPEIQQGQKIQARCLRLKQGAPTSCLFPDYAEITMNGHLIKEFEPINRQSCLKYRKDQPFNLIRGDYYPCQENSFTMSQIYSPARERQIRYEAENHLFGIFLVEEMRIDSLIHDIKEENTLGFSESATVLHESFNKFGKGDEELSLELVKVSLNCPLSTVRIDVPARGIFCHHFQCFDLKNYLTLISQSANPRWNCPICRAPAYELEVDSIIQQILRTIKGNDKIKQILFFRNGDYTGIIDEQPERDRKNIRSLNIPQRKRKNIVPQIQEKPAKRNFVVPDNVDIIELD